MFSDHLLCKYRLLNADGLDLKKNLIIMGYFSNE